MDSTLKLANLLKQKKYKTLIFLNYSPELKEFLYWCQQLIAESLEKNLGFMPVISNCPKDHQVYYNYIWMALKIKFLHI